MEHTLSNARYPRLVGDIGGTNARFACQLYAGAELGEVAEYACADFDSLASAVRHYLCQESTPTPREMAVGVACAVNADRVAMLNNSWNFSIQSLQQELGLDRLLVINDFSALALSLPSLRRDQLVNIGGVLTQNDRPKIVVGPGTGLGLAALVRSPEGRCLVIAGEGGHGSMAAVTAEQEQILELLRREFGHVSAERVLSGPGLVNLYRAAATIGGLASTERTPRQVVESARSGCDFVAEQAVRLFIEFLGSFAGNQALSFGALGGVYLGGGVLGHLGSLLDASVLRQHFEAKGRLASYLQPIPLWLIQAPYPALQGALNALSN